MKLSSFAGNSGVLGLWFNPDAAAYYRLDIPITSVGGAIHEWTRMTPELIESAHTLVVSRLGLDVNKPISMIGDIFNLLRDNNKRRILVDIDDDLPALPAYSKAATKQTTERAMEAVRRADGIITTNSTLASRMKSYNRVIYVVPNHVRSADWPEPTPHNDSLTWIVLAGSHTHDRDWEIVNRALHKVKQQRADVRLRVLGYLPAYLVDICDDFIPWSSIEAYQQSLYGNDIGIAPLPDSAFNRCKSPIKAYEYALAGMAVIASPTQYGPILAEGRGLICYTHNDWERALLTYIDDAARRKADAAALRQYVIDHRDIRLADLSSVYK